MEPTLSHAWDEAGPDYLVLGAGPAGLQLSYFLQRNNRHYLTLEAGPSPGTFFHHYPRHGKLISINKVATGFDDPDKNLRWDWNSLLTEDGERPFTEYSREYFPPASAMCRYLEDFASTHDLNIRYGRRVVRIERDEGFVLYCESGEVYRAKRVIVATGLSHLRRPIFPGAEHCEGYDACSIDAESFFNQRVMVVGKGNSGLETADHLISTTAAIHLISPSPLRLAWKTHYVGDLRAVNNNFLDTYQLKSQNTILDASIQKIEKTPEGQLRVHFLYSHAQGQETCVEVDRVIACTGFVMDRSIFSENTMPAACHKGKYPQLTSAWESANVKDLYFAGALMHGRDHRKSFSGFIHGFRYNVRCLHQILEARYEGAQHPFDEGRGTAETLKKHIIDRVNGASSLFQQPAFLSDTLFFEADGSFRYYRDIPVDYLMEDDALGFRDGRCMVVTMEYGKLAEHQDPFNNVRYPSDGTKSAFIHPVIRSYRNGSQIGEHHVPEDLENNWDQEFYTAPLVDHLAQMLASFSQSPDRASRLPSESFTSVE